MNQFNWFRIRSFTIWLSLAVGLMACAGEEAGPEEVQKRLRSTISLVAQETEAATAFLDELPPAPVWLGESIVVLYQAFGDIIPISGPVEGPEEQPGSPREGNRIANLSDDISGDAIADMLIDDVFNQENYEGNGMYRLHGQSICELLAGELPSTEQCVREVDNAGIRLHARLVGEDGLDIDMLVGAQRYEPLSFELRPDLISAVLDLDEAKSAYKILAVTELEALSEMRGRLQATLRVNGAADVSLLFSILDDVHIRLSSDDESLPTSFTSRARDPLLALRFHGGTTRLHIDADLGRTELSVPLTMVNPELQTGQELDIRLQGLSFSTALDLNSDELMIGNIGLGNSTSTVSLDGEVLVAVDLNPSHGRRFDLALRRNIDDLAQFVVTPRLDLAIGLDLRPLARAGHEIPDFLLNESYRIILAGAGQPSVEPVRPDAEGDFPGGLRVLNGWLALSSTAAAEEVLVGASQCLIVGEPNMPDAHPLLGRLISVDCPPSP